MEKLSSGEIRKEQIKYNITSKQNSKIFRDAKVAYFIRRFQNRQKTISYGNKVIYSTSLYRKYIVNLNIVASRTLLITSHQNTGLQVSDYYSNQSFKIALLCRQFRSKPYPKPPPAQLADFRY